MKGNIKGKLDGHMSGFQRFSRFFAVKFTLCMRLSVRNLKWFSIRLFQLRFQLGILVVRKIELESNESILRANSTLENDGIHDSILNFTVETHVVLENLIAICKVCLPEDENDTTYERVYLKTAIDLKKMTRSVKVNWIIKIFIVKVLESFDLKLEFPMKKVRKRMRFSQVEN